MTIKVLHAAHMRTPAAGVIRQMEEEQRAADEIGLSWHSRMFCPKGTAGDICVWAMGSEGWLASKREFYRWLSDMLPSYDVLLLRYARSDPFQINFLKDATKPVFTVHHTLEVSELDGDTTLKGRVKQHLEAVLGKRALAHVNGVLGVTSEIAQYQVTRSGIPDLYHFVYPNGAIYFDGCVVEDRVDCEVPEFLFIASNYSSWIGLDLMIDALNNSSRDVRVHIVGGLSDVQKAALAEESRFVVHGFLDHDSMVGLIAKSSLGIGSLALFRNNMKEGNTLKVKEYLRAGLPVYSGYKDVFDDEFPYYKNGPVDLDLMLEFVDQMRPITPQEISDAARPFIEKQVLLECVYDQLAKDVCS